ncbi:MAG: hypothetical protein J6X86_04360 [Bacteroidales bacterium]|nr:hypothetical protein [Bacteroidales bacterium]
MEKSAFNVKLSNMTRYSMLDKSEIQQEKNRYPYCALLQVMDLLSDKATGTSQWETRFLPRTLLYLFDNKRFFEYLSQVGLAEIQTPADLKAKQEVEQAKSLEYSANEPEAFDIMKEINAYQEVSFKTAPKSVILSKFLESGNYKPEDLGNTNDIPIEVLGKNSIRENDSLDTETLAIVLEKQGKFEKAIDVYEKLISKYPEKSSTFAIRISELKLKIENNKK